MRKLLMIAAIFFVFSFPAKAQEVNLRNLEIPVTFAFAAIAAAAGQNCAPFVLVGLYLAKDLLNLENALGANVPKFTAVHGKKQTKEKIEPNYKWSNHIEGFEKF